MKFKKITGLKVVVSYPDPLFKMLVIEEVDADGFYVYVGGKRVNLAVYKTEARPWNVVEVTTGFRVGSYRPTKDDAIRTTLIQVKAMDSALFWESIEGGMKTRKEIEARVV